MKNRKQLNLLDAINSQAFALKSLLQTPPRHTIHFKTHPPSIQRNTYCFIYTVFLGHIKHI